MRVVINYLSDMLPFIAAALPFYLIVRLIILKKKNNKVNWYHEIALTVFAIFIIGLASQTIIPEFEVTEAGNFAISNSRVHTTNLIPFRMFIETYREAFVNEHFNYFIVNIIGNITIFMPVGFFIPLLWEISDKKVIIISFCSTFFIECCQLFLNRATDIDDIILNTVGAAFGLFLYRLLYKKLTTHITKFR